MGARTHVRLLVLATVVLVAAGGRAGAQTCDSDHTIEWPATNPVWRVCWVSPQDSSGIDGSGLELTWAAYRGKPVLARGHVPVLNVKYDPGGCGGADLSYRDWADELERFEAENVIRPGYAEPTAPPVTVCEHPGSDSGSFFGVAAEKQEDRLVLSTQIRAGWYRYIQTWTFHEDGRLQPGFRFTAVDNPCTPLAHYHNVYWRLDLNVDGPAADVVEQYDSGAWVPLTTEAQQIRNPTSSRKWRVRDKGTGGVWEIVPGPDEDVADAWAVADLWALAARATEMDDGGATSGANGDRAQIGRYLTNEPIDGQDVVVWYRGGFRHDGPADCEHAGPSLVPMGGPALAISDANVAEGPLGTTEATFTATLWPTTAQTVTVDWSTTDGTASSTSDYTSASGTLTFAPGVSTQTVSVIVSGDAVSEPNETFLVNLSGATAAAIADAQGVGTIVDDDAPAGGIAFYDATLRAPRCAGGGSACDSGPSLLNGRDGKGPEPNQPNTVNASCADGTGGAYHVDESVDRLKVSTVDGSALAPGKTVRVEATVWAWTTPSDDRLQLFYAANASNPSWTSIATLTPAVPGAQTLSATYALPSGTLQAVRARIRYKGTAGACQSGSYEDHDDLVFAVGTSTPPAPDNQPPSTTITAPTAGATVSATVTIVASAGDNLGVTRVEFYADGGLKGTDTTAPYSYALDTTTLPNGSHRISSKAFDAADNSGGSLDVNVTVNNQTAVFSAALRAPTCGTVAGLCDSGPTLLNGRDGKGPEPNQPNTINGTCADGTQGVYHSDESTDRVRVLTTDGLPFAAGKMVRVEATVWAWTTPSADKLDLYYAADALGPVWTLIGTLTPPGAGSRVLSTTYTLPTGSLQAVRARFRYQGSATSCSAGSYNDHDDLVFAVQ